MLFREKKNLLFVGFELGDKISQISYCRTDRPQPETISLVAGKEQYSIPTLLCKRHDVNQWFFGKDAVKHGDGAEGILVENLVERSRNGEQIELDNEQFDAISLLALFVKRSLSLLTLTMGADQPDYLMITVEKLDNRMVEVLNQVGSYLHMDREHLFFQSHVESFYQYCMHQPEELRMHEVIALDASSGVLKSARMECNRRTNPVVAFINEQTYEQFTNEPLAQDEPYHTRQAEQKDQLLRQIVEELTTGYIVSCIYLIGDTFSGDWCRESLRFMCRNRRVFQGNNLYSKGACHAVYEKIVPGEISGKYIYLGEDKVKSNIGMMAVIQGKEQYYPLLDAGINWFDIEREWEFILESGNELHFVITPLTGKERKQLKMVLEGFPNRPDNASRVRLRMSFESERHMELSVKDLGFGDFFAPCDTVFEEIVEL